MTATEEVTANERRHYATTRRCEACGIALTPTESSWDVHERWDYDDAAVDGHVQRLRRLLVLCRACHHATHFGLATVRHTSEEALCHLMKVNIWTREEATAHVRAAYATWKKRSELDWKLDLGILTRAGLRVVMPPEASNRRRISTEHRKRGSHSG